VLQCGTLGCERQAISNPSRPETQERNRQSVLLGSPRKGAQCLCDACATWAKTHPEARHTIVVTWIRAHPEQWLEINRAKNRRRRARKQGQTVHFTPQEFETLKRQLGYRCIGCWKTETELRLLGRTLAPDHIISLKNGGLDCIENIQPLCHSGAKGSTKGCNNNKGIQTLDYLIS